MENIIYGRGGGGGDSGSSSSRTAVEYPDTLSSKSYVKAIDLLGEGEFDTVLVGGLKGLFLDDVPVMNQDGTYNFTGISVETRSGTLSQTRMTVGDTTESTESVGTELRYNVPVEYTVSSEEVDVIRINIKVPSLTVTDTSTGDISGTSVSYSVEWKELSSPTWNSVGTQTISGKTNSEYERQTSFRITGIAPWIIRVNRLTVDSTSAYLQNKTYLSSVTTVLEEKLRYPGSVLVGGTYDAEQFSSIPSRAFLCKCLKVKIPTNYDPVMRVYSGAWDGSFKVAWTDNPAWCFYDLLTNTRYGLGNRIPESYVDKAELYSIGQYCDELVPGYDGVHEPRFTCNVVLQTKEQAYQVISDFASIFRGMTYWAAGVISPVQDRAQDVKYAFNNTNVVDGVFTYQSSNLSSRYNAAYVTWNNPNNFYKREVEYVEDSDLITSLGYVNSTSIVAFGCASRGMARRVGKWLIYTNNYQTDTVVFSTGAEGSIPRPGDVIKISDTLRSQDRRGGRIVSSTLSSIVLDIALTFVDGIVYTLSAVDTAGNLVDTTFIASGSTNTITLTTPLTTALAPDSIFIIADDDIEPQQFKVISVTDSGKSVYEITALSHNPSKYAYIEQNIPLTDFNLPNSVVNPVVGIKYDEYMYADGVSIKSRCDISWKAPTFAKKYIVDVRFPDGTVTSSTETSPSYTIYDTTPGDYTVSITSVNILKTQALAFSQTIHLYGKTKQPNPVENFEVNAVGGQAYLTWNTHSDLDVLVGGWVVITHTAKTTGAVWSDGIFVTKVPGASVAAFVPLLGGTYMAKALDSSGEYSTTPALASAEYAILQNKNYVDILQESTDFDGVKTNMKKDGLSLTLEPNLLIDSAGNVDSYSSFDYLGGGVYTTGEYAFSRIVDLGAVYKVNVSGSILARSVELFSYIDERTTLIDTWAYFDSLVPESFITKIFISTTNDDTTSSPVWSDWAELKVSTYSARGFKFKLYVESVSEAYSVYVDGLSASIDVDDRVVGENDITCTTSGLDIIFNPPFMLTPAISVAINNMIEGDYYEISSKSSEGFSFVVKNNGNPVERTIDYIAKGYGYKIV